MRTKFLAFALLFVVFMAVVIETIEAKKEREEKTKGKKEKKDKKEKRKEKKCVHGCNMAAKDCKKEVRNSTPSAAASPVQVTSPALDDGSDSDDGSDRFAECKLQREVCKAACFPAPSASATPSLPAVAPVV